VAPGVHGLAARPDPRDPGPVILPAAPGPATATFALPVADDLDLVLREPWTVAPLHRVVLANLEHLRAWEPWAHGEQTEEALRSYSRTALHSWADGWSLPCAIRYRGALVGTLGARIESWSQTAEIGFWLDAAHQGHGIVTRCVDAAVEHLVTVRGIARLEIRTAVGNDRTLAVAERCGFAREGVMRSAQSHPDGRRDLVVLARTAADGGEHP
jgi:ribosomal-protein-serine acetyltransferase